jgi:serine/threonine protein kinase
MAERFGDFELLTLLSADAALESYLAALPGGSAQVVLRRMRPSQAQQPGARDAFLNDAHAAMRLQHSSVARIVAVGEVGHRPYLAQERVDGQSLESILARARSMAGWPLPLPRALALFLPVLEGLAAAHAQTPALCHREVSPRNVYVTLGGRAVLSGFALARTRRSAGLGIADAFLSPEQMSGRPLDAASDVFTAGLVLFELVCGRLPATGAVGEIAARIGALELDAPEAAHAQSAPLAAVLKKALARHDDRYAHAGQFLEALKALNLPLEAAPELSKWLAELPEEPLPPPAKLPVEPPRPVAAQSAAAAAPAVARAVVVPPVEPSAPAPTPRFSTRTKVIAALAVATAAIVGIDLTIIFSAGSADVQRAAPNPIPEKFETELVTVPPGASVRIDEKRYGKTPVVVPADRDAVYTVHFENEENGFDLLVQNAKRIEVEMETGEVLSEDRWVAGPSRVKKDKKKNVAVDPATEAKADEKTNEKTNEKTRPHSGATVYEDTAPTRFVLNRTHQVRVDDVAALPLRSDTLQQVESGYRNGPTMAEEQPAPLTGKTRSEVVRSLNQSPWIQARNQGYFPGVLRHLSMVLTRMPNGVQLRPVEPQSQLLVPALPSWAFALSERAPGSSESSPTFRFGQNHLGGAGGASLVVLVERDNRFTVKGLKGLGPWKLALKLKDPKRAAGVVLKVLPEAPEQAAVLDGTPLETQTAVLSPDGSYLLSGAREIWFAVPTVTGYQASEIDVSVEPAAK